MKKITTKIIAAALAMLTLLSFAGCALLAKEPVTYDNGSGLTVVMPEGMQDLQQEGFVMSYADNHTLMTAVREGFAEYVDYGFDLENMTMEEYAELCQDVNGLEEPFTADANGNYYTTYTADVDGDNFYYYCTLRKGSDAFWVVTFACLESEMAKYEAEFVNWSNSIVVA